MFCPRAALERVGLAEFVISHAPGGISRTANEQVDFAQSIAYVRARTELGVRINLEGRDPAGVVSPAAYERIREELIRDLQSVKTPDGEPFFETVAPSERYFHGPHHDATVDIVTIPANFDHMITEQLGGTTDGYFDSAEPWNHKLEGVFVAAGDGIDSDTALDSAHIFDVAPTIMAAMDLPVSDRMDGSVVPVLDSTDAVESISYPSYEDDEISRTEPDADVTERLADLGYME